MRVCAACHIFQISLRKRHSTIKGEKRVGDIVPTALQMLGVKSNSVSTPIALQQKRQSSNMGKKDQRSHNPNETRVSDL